MTTLHSIKEWFESAVPNPTIDNLRVQVGCDLEEISEYLYALGLINEAESIGMLATRFKSEKVENSYIKLMFSTEESRTAILDAMADRLVTSLGVCHMAKMDFIGGSDEVNQSNWSKFVDGKPVFDENGKIKKGDGYFKPNLKPFI